LMCWGFGDAYEGLRFCSLEVVSEETWIRSSLGRI